MEIQKNLVRMSVSDLIPYEKNPRKIPEEAINDVCESYKQCGVIDPIEIDEENVILSGHTRRLAALKMGINEVDCLRVEGLTSEQKRKYRILANKTGEKSMWDFNLLEWELEDIDFEGYDFGFDIPEPNNSFSTGDVEEADDFEPNVPAEPKAKRGQIYQLGNHRLMCGDSTSDDVKTLIDCKNVDMVFTDPPYGYEYQSNERTKTGKFAVLKNDDKILDFFPLLEGIVNGFVMVCTTWKVLDKWLPLFKSYFNLTNMLIWNKGGGGIGDLTHTFATDYEIILCANNGAEIQEKRIGSVWEIGKDNPNSYKHPTQKPVALAEYAIMHTTKKQDIVLDLFGGSGSTLIACEQLNRKCYMMELDPCYVDVIIDRWEQFTGKQAVLLNG